MMLVTERVQERLQEVETHPYRSSETNEVFIPCEHKQMKQIPIADNHRWLTLESGANSLHVCMSEAASG